MSKFLLIPVTGLDPVLVSAENVATVTRFSATKTYIKYPVTDSSGTNVFLTAQLTHTSETTSGSVREVLVDAILSVHSGSRRPEIFQSVVMPSGIAVSAIAYAYTTA
jgi:hypothetical protein